MTRLIPIFILCSALSFASRGQSSVSETTGFWASGSTWIAGVMPGTESAGTITATSKVVVIDGTVNTLNNLVLNFSSITINASDTLVILGNLTETGSLVSNNGVLIVFGNVTNTGSTNFISGSGKLVVTGDYSTSFGANFFTGPSYVYGSTSGFLTPPAIGDEPTLQVDDPDLYDYVQDTYGVLPIELVYFNAIMVNQEVRLQWATASEINNDHFIIERSPDGINYTLLTNLPGAGNSKIELQYEFSDPYPLSGRSYYRLGQMDYDGNSSDFVIATVFNDTNSSFEIYPNPTTDFLYFSERCSDCSVTLGDNHGRFAPESIKMVEAANGKVGVDMSSLDAGVYIIRLSNPETLVSSTFRVIKK